MLKLSICMIVKNEEKNLSRCLNSLESLRKRVATELIVVDTGSSDNTVEIAKQYHANIFYHLWNNDFSSMRNISLDYAKGEWILIIDADEALQSCDDMVEFLNQEHDKDIAGATLYVQNVKNEEGTILSSSLISPRIFRNNSGMHYEGEVHNSPIFYGNLKEIPEVIYHYGYINSDKELMEKKFQRTSKLLLNHLSKNPENIYYRYQLATTYDMHGDFELAIDQIKSAYALIEKKSLKSRYEYLYIYSAYAKLMAYNGHFVEAIEISEKGIALEKEYLDLYFFKAVAFAKVGAIKQAKESYLTYLNVLNGFEDSEIRKNPAIQHYTISSKVEALYNLAIISEQLHSNEDAFIYSKRVLNEQPFNSEYHKRIIPLYLKHVFDFNDYMFLSMLLENESVCDEIKEILSEGFLLGVLNILREDNFSVVDNILETLSGSQLEIYQSIELLLLIFKLTSEGSFEKLSKVIQEYIIAFDNPIVSEAIYKLLGRQNLNSGAKACYQELSKRNDALGVACYLKMHINRFELVDMTQLDIKQYLDEIICSTNILYQDTLYFLLSHIDVLDYIGSRYSETRITLMTMALLDDLKAFSNLIDHLVQQFDNILQGSTSIRKVACVLLKSYLMTENGCENYEIFNMYLKLLFDKLEMKYNALFLEACLIEDLNTEEEAFGLLLMRALEDSLSVKLDLIEMASHKLPSMSKLIKQMVLDMTNQPDEMDVLCMEIIKQSNLLIENDLYSDALVVLKQALEIAPNNKLILDQIKIIHEKVAN